MRPLLSVVTAGFTLAAVVHAGSGMFGGKPYDVKAEAAIHLMPFIASDCTDAPQQSPHEMKNGQCINFLESRSIKPMFWKGHRADWIDEVNKVRIHCKLETFSQYQCPDMNRTTVYRHGYTDEQPKNFNKCLMPAREKWQGTQNSKSEDESHNDEYTRLHAIRSARFICGPVEKSEYLCTRTLRHTSWSIDPTYGSPVSEVQDATYTGTVLATPHSKAVVASGKPEPQHKLTPRGAAVEDVAAAEESKGVWMLHPWSLSMVCYKCYTEKPGDYRDIECRMGKGFPISCGPRPPNADQLDGSPERHSTTTTTVTAVSTTHSTRTKKTVTYKDHTSTIIGVFLTDDSTDEDFVDLEIDLHMRKSWHTPVKFPHPFLPDRTGCADAEWEKRGQGAKQYIKLQKVHICDDKDRRDSRWLGRPTTIVHTSTATKTSSFTFGHTTTSTSTAAVGTTTTKIVRHDQL